MAINKILLTCILMCSALTSSAQIELDHTFPDGFVNGHFHESNDVIYARSISSGTVGDYTMEFYFYNAEYQSLGSTTFNSSFFTIPQYVTRHLFNLDDTIEFITTTIDGTQIRDINGNVLFESVCGSAWVYNTINGAKLLVSCEEEEETRIYSLPGSLPSGMAENTNPELLAYPNPTKSFINIPTEGVSQIEVFNTMGQKVFEVPSNGSQYQQIPTAQLAPGTYIYQTKNDQEVKPGKMFVVE